MITKTRPNHVNRVVSSCKRQGDTHTYYDRCHFSEDFAQATNKRGPEPQAHAKDQAPLRNIVS